MSIDIDTSYGQINVSSEVITMIAGCAAVDCHGIVGMASQRQLKDGLSELLGRDNLGRGIVVREEEGSLTIDMYIIVSYGTKISDVARLVQTKVNEQLKQMLGIKAYAVNIFVQGVRMIEDV
ncbi:putative alkaline shock family protein YloU [Scopulibacillus daqui]|uniref:Alkaline shock family protein YloU n=1 Tax=Scopulibacillus daqui TaxID=1469162 RepID=A0ABS2PYC4_9BACL|nr:Asp23/Gls24 family envelope stress response protein [Scopulibacillus daqui]MBM7644317.1 putative alkaline shock family protein YloU [Scopulibacillus daqui]